MATQTRYVDQCGPALTQHRVNFSCFLGGVAGRTTSWCERLCLLVHRPDAPRWHFVVESRPFCLRPRIASSKQDKLNQCCFDVAPQSATLVQHQNNIGCTSPVSSLAAFRRTEPHPWLEFLSKTTDRTGQDRCGPTLVSIYKFYFFLQIGVIFWRILFSLSWKPKFGFHKIV